MESRYRISDIVESQHACRLGTSLLISAAKETVESARIISKLPFTIHRRSPPFDFTHMPRAQQSAYPLISGGRSLTPVAITTFIPLHAFPSPSLTSKPPEGRPRHTLDLHVPKFDRRIASQQILTPFSPQLGRVV